MKRIVPLLALLALPAWGEDVDKALQRDFHARGQATMDRVKQEAEAMLSRPNTPPPQRREVREPQPV